MPAIFLNRRERKPQPLPSYTKSHIQRYPHTDNALSLYLGTTFEEFLSRPCIDKSALSNSFETEAAILLPILNKRKAYPPSLEESGHLPISPSPKAQSEH